MTHLSDCDAEMFLSDVAQFYHFLPARALSGDHIPCHPGMMFGYFRELQK
jgi:hypothetical protein